MHRWLMHLQREHLSMVSLNNDIFQDSKERDDSNNAPA